MEGLCDPSEATWAASGDRTTRAGSRHSTDDHRSWPELEITVSPVGSRCHPRLCWPSYARWPVRGITARSRRCRCVEESRRAVFAGGVRPLFRKVKVSTSMKYVPVTGSGRSKLSVLVLEGYRRSERRQCSTARGPDCCPRRDTHVDNRNRSLRFDSVFVKALHSDLVARSSLERIPIALASASLVDRFDAATTSTASAWVA